MNQVAIKGFSADMSEQPAYMALTIGSLSLLAASADVVSIESVDEIDQPSPAHSAVGSIHYYGQDIPAYSVTENLDVESATSDDKTICVVLKHDKSLIALLCSKAAPFEHPIIRSFPLPECMRANRTPIRTLCLYRIEGKDDIACVISADSIIDYIENSQRNAQDVDYRRMQPS